MATQAAISLTLALTESPAICSPPLFLCAISCFLQMGSLSVQGQGSTSHHTSNHKAGYNRKASHERERERERCRYMMTYAKNCKSCRNLEQIREGLDWTKMKRCRGCTELDVRELKGLVDKECERTEWVGGEAEKMVGGEAEKMVEGRRAR
ncbi:hypothetical protein GOP47_0025997 [Adiantum capillus-veneris]|uniref:Uncharacterized protein n=1 Tax=Adiantum capillus-veneris TaxID=13818 RepID=A0A9D4Z2K8_ADICA|nr:hypothetical protein GOP47_0025997 [Adiantum capillus-veneris]